MENQQHLSERVIGKVLLAEQLAVRMDMSKFKVQEDSDIEQDLEQMKRFVEASEAWNEAAKQAAHFCRLARCALPEDELISLIERLHMFDPEKELWDFYVLAEWSDEFQWHDEEADKWLLGDDN